MVSFDRPIPKRFSHIRCRNCDSPIKPEKVDKIDDSAFCRRCFSWTTVYRGPQRPGLCGSCFHNTGRDQASGKVLCADGLYEKDGLWYTLNGTLFGKFPKFVGKTYTCPFYEDLEGKTREEVKRDDPLKFFKRNRLSS